jgi:hypothetical protein
LGRRINLCGSGTGDRTSIIYRDRAGRVRSPPARPRAGRSRTTRSCRDDESGRPQGERGRPDQLVRRGLGRSDSVQRRCSSMSRMRFRRVLSGWRVHVVVGRPKASPAPGPPRVPPPASPAAAVPAAVAAPAAAVAAPAAAVPAAAVPAGIHCRCRGGGWLLDRCGELPACIRIALARHFLFRSLLTPPGLRCRDAVSLGLAPITLYRLTGIRLSAR